MSTTWRPLHEFLILHEETYVPRKLISDKDWNCSPSRPITTTIFTRRERERRSKRELYQDSAEETGFLTSSGPDPIIQLLCMPPVLFRGTFHNTYLSHQDLRPHRTPSKHALKITCMPAFLYLCTASTGKALHNICAWNPALPWKDLTSLHEDSHQHPTAINTVTALHDKLTSRLQEATYSAPYLWFSCLVMPFLWEGCFTALRQLCTSSSIFQCFKLKSIRLCFWTTTKVIST